MSYAAIVTLVIVGVIVVALACYLLTILAIVLGIGSRLGQVAVGVRTIADRTQPIGPAVDEVNAALTTVADGLEDLAAKSGARRFAATGG